MASDPPTIAIEPTVSNRDNGNGNGNGNSDNERSQNNTTGSSQPKLRWKRILGVKDTADSDADSDYNETPKEKWTMGILNDRETEEVPGEPFSSLLSRSR